MPQEDYAALKEMTFLGFIFKLISSSHLNTSSIWSNISSMLVANTQICGKGKASLTTIEFSFQWSTQSQISPVLFLTKTTCEAYRLLDGLMMPCLSHALRHFWTSPWYCLVIILWGRYTGLSLMVSIEWANLSQTLNPHCGRKILFVGCIPNSGDDLVAPY